MAGRDAFDMAAEALLSRLLEQEGIELVSSRGIAVLRGPLSSFILDLETPEGRAEAIADWLMQQAEVADLFAEDEAIEAALTETWDRYVQAAEQAAAEKATAEEDPG
jgi:hypothetical protein